MVGGFECAAGGSPHARIPLYAIDGAHVFYAGNAERGGRHGALARDRGDLRRDCLLRFAAHARDWHSHGARSATAYADLHVRPARIVAYRHRHCLRVGWCVRGDASDVVAAVQCEPGRSNHLRGGNGRRRRHCLSGVLLAVSPRSNGGPSGRLARGINKSWTVRNTINKTFVISDWRIRPSVASGLQEIKLVESLPQLLAKALTQSPVIAQGFDL